VNHGEEKEDLLLAYVVCDVPRPSFAGVFPFQDT
jgi:hypothetical protein